MRIIHDPYAAYVILNFIFIALSTWGLLVTGAVLLAEARGANRRLAGWINGAIVTSFLFANVGFAFVDVTQRSLEPFFENIGSSMLFLGFTLFLGIAVLSHMRNLSVSGQSSDTHVEDPAPVRRLTFTR